MHVGTSGIQSHSVGPTYPWRVVLVENRGEGRGVQRAFNGETGEVAAEIPYWIDVEGDSLRAYAEAERVCEERSKGVEVAKLAA